MAVSPWKTYKRVKNLLWSGRSRRLAKIVDQNAKDRAEANNETPPQIKTPGGRN